MVTLRSFVLAVGTNVKSVTARLFGKSVDDDDEPKAEEHTLPYRQLAILGMKQSHINVQIEPRRRYRANRVEQLSLDSLSQ